VTRDQDVEEAYAAQFDAEHGAGEA